MWAKNCFSVSNIFITFMIEYLFSFKPIFYDNKSNCCKYNQPFYSVTVVKVEFTDLLSDLN